MVGAAIEVHRHFKAGLKENIYEECLCIELKRRGIPFKRQYRFTPSYKGVRLSSTSVVDLFVDDALVVELKAITEVLPVHHAQAINYMNLLRVPKALIINFHTTNISSEGRFTFVNEIYANLPKD